MPAPSLAQTQQLLWTLITAPEGAAAGLAQLDPTDRGVAASLANGDARLSALERLDIYANMYFYRIRDCLKEDFVAVCAVVGDDNFHNLITDYLLVHPPTHFSLRYAGQHLPTFLLGHSLSTRWPYLPDLAKLEWAILEAFDAADAPPLQPAALAEVPQDRWPELRLQLTPSLQLFDLAFAVHNVWRAAQDGKSISEPRHQETSVRVWRQDLRVFHHAMDAVERDALRAVAADACFADVCERIVARDREAADAERALALLGEWLGDGLLIGYRFD
jgi:putative DNA-binding protein